MAVRERIRDDAAFRTGRVGLAVAELQVVHHGHVALLSRMLCSCDRAILALGSTQAARTPGHPFTFDERVRMVEAVFGPGLFSFVPLQDIDASTVSDEWVTYVTTRIRKLGLPEPTDLYTGSRVDALYYETAFARLTDDRETHGPEEVHPSDGRHDGAATATRTIRVVDRTRIPVPSGREIRTLIERREPRWRLHVPQRLWRWIEANYPGESRLALRGYDLPSEAGLPVGTRFIRSDGGPLLELKDDGAWRPVRFGPDDKAGHALRTRTEG